MKIELCALFIYVSFLSACSLTKDTKDMKKTTEEMNKTSDEIRAKSEHLSKRTDDLEEELTGKESYAMLTLNLDNLFGKNPTSGEEQGLNSEPDMLIFAGASIHSMLFQYWKGDYNEDLALLDERFALHAEILFLRSLKHIPRTFQVNVFFPDNSYKAISAIGAKLDHESDSYSKAITAAGLKDTASGKDLSLYDVILGALRGRDQFVRSEILPKATAQVLQYKQEAIYMLQLRHNFLPMMVVSRISDFSDLNTLQRGILLASGRQIDLAKMDVEQLKEWTLWLNKAVATRKALRELGIQPEYNSNFRNVVAAMSFNQAGVMTVPLEKLTPLMKLQREFLEAYAAVVAN